MEKFAGVVEQRLKQALQEDARQEEKVRPLLPTPLESPSHSCTCIDPSIASRTHVPKYAHHHLTSILTSSKQKQERAELARLESLRAQEEKECQELDAKANKYVGLLLSDVECVVLAHGTD